MKKALKIIGKSFADSERCLCGSFPGFFFDLDGKALFYGVEPFLVRHYDNMERKDPLSQVYGMDKPSYEYNV